MLAIEIIEGRLKSLKLFSDVTIYYRHILSKSQKILQMQVKEIWESGWKVPCLNLGTIPSILQTK